MILSEAAGAQPVVVGPTTSWSLGSLRVWTERADRHSRLTREVPFFVLASAVIAVSFLLPTLQSHHAWINIPCAFYKATHLPCLACGLTRSYVYTAHGNLTSAFEMHLLGPLLFVGTCAAALYFGFASVSGIKVRYEVSKTGRRIAFWSVLGIFLVCWGLKIAFLRGGW